MNGAAVIAGCDATEVPRSRPACAPSMTASKNGFCHKDRRRQPRDARYSSLFRAEGSSGRVRMPAREIPILARVTRRRSSDTSNGCSDSAVSFARRSASSKDNADQCGIGGFASNASADRPWRRPRRKPLVRSALLFSPDSRGPILVRISSRVSHERSILAISCPMPMFPSGVCPFPDLRAGR